MGIDLSRYEGHTEDWLKLASEIILVPDGVMEMYDAEMNLIEDAPLLLAAYREGLAEIERLRKELAVAQECLFYLNKAKEG